jgi:hypothetical protein
MFQYLSKWLGLESRAVTPANFPVLAASGLFGGPVLTESAALNLSAVYCASRCRWYSVTSGRKAGSSRT